MKTGDKKVTVEENSNKGSGLWRTIFSHLHRMRVLENIIFQQDNYKKHPAKATQKWFDDNNANVVEWSRQSPDLDPIDNLCYQKKILKVELA